MQHSGARKREWSDAHDGTGGTYACSASRSGANGAFAVENEGEVIEKEMKRLRLAQDDREFQGGRRWPDVDDGDVEMDVDDCGTESQSHHPLALALASPRVDYRPINLTLRECHYLRQLRRFQSERVSYLERRAPTDAAAAAVMHAMQGRRR